MSLQQTISDPNVQKFITPFATGLIAIASGWAVNQLPAVQNAGQGWRVLKLAIEVAILAVVVASWADAVKAIWGSDEIGQLAGLAYALMVLFLLIVCSYDVWRLFRKPSQSATIAADPEAARKRHNRQALMDSVRIKWIRGVLEKSLYQQTRIELGLEECPEMVSVELQRSGQERRMLPQGRRVFDEFADLGEGGTLLILGEAGSGKTTLLLELACDLLNATDAANPDHAVPVVLNLSSWGTVKREGKPVKTLREWLIEELYVQYSVRREVSDAWLKENNLVLLLDGLDEVREEWRDDCVTAISQFQPDHGAIEIVVCSRIADYEKLKTRLDKFREAILIQPLSEEQVENYWQQAGHRLDGVRSTVQQDAELQALARKPLFLSILSLTYKDKLADELLNQSQSEQLRLLFDRYIQQMFQQRNTDYQTQAQMKRWLSILAKQMGSEKEFLIERMQPREWLYQPKHKWQYRLILGLILELVGGVGGGLIGGLIGELSGGLIGGLSGGLSGGLTVGLGGGLIGGLDKSIYLVEAIQLSLSPSVRQEVARELREWLIGGLRIGLIFGLNGGLSGVLGGVLVGELIGGLSVGLIFGLIGGLSVGLIFGLIGGLQRDIQIRTRPNQGILNSRNNMLITCGCAIVFTLLLYLLFSQTLSLMADKAMATGIISSVIWLPFWAAFLAGGGVACIQHFALRVVLHRANRIPWNFVTFFQQAEDRLFIQRTGGSYIFIHRSLQEHFASLAPND